MPEADLVRRLMLHSTLSTAPRHELDWFASRATLRQMQRGEVLTAKGTRPAGLFAVLSGSFAMSVDRGAGPRKVMEWRAGDVMGLLPYSRVTGPPGDSVAQEPSEILMLPSVLIRELAEQCHEITAILVHAMLDRARAFTSSDLHDEKMVSLGKLSAGLAHELNNPASAIERNAAVLADRVEEMARATRALAALGLTAAQLAAVDAAQAACSHAHQAGVRSPLDQAQREEDIEDWLARHGVPPALAVSLADTAVTFQALDTLAAVIDGPALGAVLRWTSSACTVQRLASEIQDSAMRISGLVIAVKGFTHMDQAPVAAPVDVVLGLTNTVTVLRAKARSKGATVVVDPSPDLPPVHGYAGELNQIWANLIDNALDALTGPGHVAITARHENQKVTVRVVDDGPGIPKPILDRIFDPFFTTKPIGQGTGLGLDIVRRLVRHNNGEIAVASQPGRTEFRVDLPVAAAGEPPK